MIGISDEGSIWTEILGREADDVKTHREKAGILTSGSALAASEEASCPHSDFTFGLQNCEKIHSLFKMLTTGTLLQQPSHQIQIPALRGPVRRMKIHSALGRWEWAS